MFFLSPPSAASKVEVDMAFISLRPRQTVLVNKIRVGAIGRGAHAGRYGRSSHRARYTSRRESLITLLSRLVLDTACGSGRVATHTPLRNREILIVVTSPFPHGLPPREISITMLPSSGRVVADGCQPRETAWRVSCAQSDECRVWVSASSVVG